MLDFVLFLQKNQIFFSKQQESIREVNNNLILIKIQNEK